MWPVDLARQGGAIAFFDEEGLVARKRGHMGWGCRIFVVGGSERAQASTLPKNMWLEDPARQGGAITLFKCFVLYCKR